jgi:hypothetical protein
LMRTKAGLLRFVRNDDSFVPTSRERPPPHPNRRRLPAGVRTGGRCRGSRW